MRLLSFALTLAGCGGILAPTTDDGGGSSSPEGSTPRPTDGGFSLDARPVGSCKSGCLAGRYCEIDKTCNSTIGNCVPGPTGCPLFLEYVCGTDGKTYENICMAHAAGVDITEKGGCPEPKGWVACGPHFCNAMQSYCMSTGNDTPGPGMPCADYQCLPLPPACVGKSDCACFPKNLCGMCKYTGNGFQQTCLGG